MSEQQARDQDAQIGGDDEAQAEAVAAHAGASPGPSRWALLLALAALLAVAAGLFAGYHYWIGMKQSMHQLNAALAQAGRDQAAMEERLTQTLKAFEQQQQKFAVQERALAEQRLRLEQERESIQQQGVQINRSFAEMPQRMGGRQSQWRVAEAEYLIKLANHRLGLMGDPSTAMAALVSADERLRDTGDPGWTQVRQTLAQEITALKAVPEVDQAGLHASLGALAHQVEELALQEEGVALQPKEQAAAQAKQESSSQGIDLARLWQDLWDGFKSMMVIRHHDQPVVAMLPPESRYFLTQNLRFKLEGAKAALMARDEAFYRNSLRTAGQWIERYFAIGTAPVDSYKAQLSQLAQVDIAPELPDISASLSQLQARREQLNQGASQ